MSFSNDEPPLRTAPWGSFEAKLLDSAKHDTPNEEVHAAWSRFTERMVKVAGNIEPTSGVHPRQSTDAARPGSRGASHVANAGAAVKWAIAGALAGSSLMAWLMLARPPSAAPHAASTASTRARVALSQAVSAHQSSGTSTEAVWPNGLLAAPSSQVVDTSVLLPTTQQPEPQRAQQVSRTADSGTSRTLPVSGTRAAEPKRPEAISLAREIARLDAARSAYQAGKYQQAARELDAYHRDFPRGALARDAEVIAIEALAASGDLRTAAQRAARFVQRYPDDPHAERVQRWVTP